MDGNVEISSIKVLSVNSGTPQFIAAKGGFTGIFKNPRKGAAHVTKDGLAGDTIVDLKHHGGVDQAVYVYCQTDYDWWRYDQGIEIHAGLFGENLTISGMVTANAHVGARLVTDTLVLEITSHRTPCDTFAARMGDGTFPKRFWNSRRTGFYCRVVKEGLIAQGNIMELQPYDGEIVAITELIEREPYSNLDKSTRERFLSTPLHYKMREELLKQ